MIVQRVRGIRTLLGLTQGLMVSGLFWSAYAVLIFYEVLALSYVGKPQTIPRMALASFSRAPLKSGPSE